MKKVKSPRNRESDGPKGVPRYRVTEKKNFKFRWHHCKKKIDKIKAFEKS